MNASPDPAPIDRGRLPSGTVSFAFTDIEGSTQRWDRDRAAMQDAVRAHDAIMRTAITARDGYVFKTIGDAFCAAFARAEDAVAAMLQAQQALSAHDFFAVGGIRIRAAVHTGTADERDGDYFGPVVNRVARLLAIGHGGQVLVSGVTRELVQALLPAPCELRDLGRHRLKDLAAPEHVFELVHPTLVPEHAPLRSLDPQANNLPVTRTEFIGRSKEIAEITASLNTHRLVTLVGAGGIGKTRTSLAVAANLLDGSGDGVWFVEFAPLSSGEYVPAAIAREFGIVLGPDGDPIEKLIQTFESKRALLIFDNCEHLIEAVGRVVSAILRSCANISILASSRKALGVAGEQTYRLPSLPLPAIEANRISANDAAHSAAVALFVARARDVDQRFTLTDVNAATVVEICRRLDGIALAIELAAARVRILSPRQLRDRLDERFRVLTAGSRDALPRQRTLRALIDWSYDLLGERERMLFRRLAVFVNGFTLEAATVVAAGDDFDEFDVIDVLGSLVDQSLVLAEDAGDALRYRMLESTRAYALERTRSAGEHDALARRHAAFFAAAAGDGVTFNASIGPALEAVETELDNMREALTWALQERNDVALGAGIAFALGRFWSTRLPREGLRWLELAQSAVAGGPDLVITAKLAGAIAAMLPHGSFERVEASRRALAAARQTDDPRVLTRALCAYGEQLSPLGSASAQAAASFEEALRYARSIDSTWDAGRALAGLATLAVERKDIVAAREIGREAIGMFESLDATDGVAYVAILLGEGEFIAGNIDRAIEFIRRGRAVHGSLHNNRSSACAANHLAAMSLAAKRLTDARFHARDALELLETDRHPYFFTSAIEHIAYLATLEGDPSRGALLQGFTTAAFERLAHARAAPAQFCYDEHVRTLSQALGEAGYRELTERGMRLSEDAALTMALDI